jgi:hypothetical protein
MTSDSYLQFRDEFGCWITDNGAEFTGGRTAPRDRIILGWLAEHGVQVSTLNDHPFAGHVNVRALRDGVGELTSPGVDRDDYHGFAHLDLTRLRTAIEDLIAEARADTTPAGLGGFTAAENKTLARAAAKLWDAYVWSDPPSGLTSREQGLLGRVSFAVRVEAEAAAAAADTAAWHPYTLSCGCRVALPVRMAFGREVLCAGHGPVTIGAVTGRLDQEDDGMMGPVL